MVSRLEELCAVSSAIALASKLEVKKTLFPSFFKHARLLESDKARWFEFMEKEVLSLIQEFHLVFREKVCIPVVIWCSFRSYKWSKFHEEKFGLTFDHCYYFLRSSFFSSKGIIDNGKAAREILKNTEISSSIRFCVACYYCFSDVISALWEQLPQDKRPKIIKGKIYTKCLGKGGKDVMVKLWSRIFLGELQNMVEKGVSFPYKFIKCFKNEVSDMNCNDVSFKNCFEELNEVQRNKAVIFSRRRFSQLLYSEVECFSPEKFLSFQPHVESIIYLLHSLDENQLKIFFQERRMLYLTLYHLLNYPYQHLFMDTVNRFGELLSKCEFLFLLCKITTLMTDEFYRKFYDFRPIFREFWVQSPPSMKTFFFQVEGNYLNAEEDKDFESFCEEFRKYHFKVDGSLVISNLFNSFSFTTEDEEIIRLIFASATSEEKLRIVEVKGHLIADIAFKVCDLNRIELFIEYCVPEGRVADFKKDLFDEEDHEELLTWWNFIICGGLLQLQKFLSGSLSGEEMREFLQKLLHSCSTLGRDAVSYSPSELKYIDKFLELILSSDGIKVFKENLVESVNSLAKHYYFLKGNFNLIETCLDWISLPQKDRQDFKRQFAFHNEIIEFYSKCVSKKQLNRTDEFLRWTKLTETEVKDFKKRLVFNERTVSSACAYLILEGNSGFVKKLLNWTQLSKENLKDFYFILLEDVTKLKTKLVDIKNFVNEFPSSEEEQKKNKKFFSLKAADVIEYYAMKNKWDEVEEVLSWCFSSKKEIEEFKKKLLLEISWLYLKLILNKRFDDLDKFFTWSGIDESSKKELLKNTVFNNRIYEVVATISMESENEILRLLNWLSANDLLLIKWKESFLNWFNETKVEETCFYSDCESPINIDSFCSSCERYSPSSKNISEFIRLVDERVSKSKGKEKRKLESSVKINSRQSKKSRHS